MSGRAGIGLGVIGVVLALLAVAGPWWTVHAEATILGQSARADAAFGLFGRGSMVESPLGSSSESTDYSDMPSVASAFTAGTALAILAIVFGLLLVLLRAASPARPGLRRVGALAGLLAFLLALSTAMYVMSTLPAAVNQDVGAVPFGLEVTGFWGSQSQSVGLFGLSAQTSWSAGWGWYVMLLAAVVLFVGGLASLRGPEVGVVLPGTSPPPRAGGPP